MGGCVVGPLWYLLSRVVCDLLVGRKASSPSSSAPLPPVCELCLGVVCSPLYLLLVWFVEDQVAGCLLLCFIGRPAARGLYGLSGRSRSGKAADSFATDDDFFDMR